MPNVYITITHKQTKRIVLTGAEVRDILIKHLKAGDASIDNNRTAVLMDVYVKTNGNLEELTMTFTTDLSNGKKCD